MSTHGTPRPIDRAETLAALATESRAAGRTDLDLRETVDLVRQMNRADAAVPDAVAEATEAIAAAIDAITARLAAGGRLLYVGAGTAGRLGVLDASECPPTFGTDPRTVSGLIAGGPVALTDAVEGAEDDAGAGAGAMADAGVSAADAVVGISASGRTPYAVAAVAEARRRGAVTVGVAANTGSALGAAADIAVETEVGPEFIAGSTRLKAGTAQKLVLNMISTITMIRLGKTYGDLMVDLRATNEKLRARARRTVVQATGVDDSAAESALSAAGGSAKAAILVLLTDVAPARAAMLLDEHGGRLRAAVDAAGTRARTMPE